MQIKSPTRIDLSGGTLDCSPLYNLIDHPCYTINLSIDVFTEVHLHKRKDKKIFIEIKSLNYKKEFPLLQECLQHSDEELSFLKPHLLHWKPDFGFQLETSSQSPIGGGLGGSSSLCISLIKAFSQLCETPLQLSEMVTLASNIEGRILKTPTGTQDYYPALQQGLNSIKYEASGPKLESLHFDEEFFKQRMLLVYTGQPHHSGLNNWQVIKAAVEKDSKTLNSLLKIAQISSRMFTVCRRQNWSLFPQLLQEEFNERVQLNPAFTSPQIEKLKDLALSHGAEAVKICGAGGGGCVLVWVPPESRTQVIEACQSHGFQIIEAQPLSPADRD